MRGVFFSLLTFLFPKYCIHCGRNDFFSELLGLCKPCTKLESMGKHRRNGPVPIPKPKDRFLFYEDSYSFQIRNDWLKELFLSLKFQNEKQIARFFCIGWKRLPKLWKEDPPDFFLLVPSKAKSGPRPYHAAWYLRNKLIQCQNLREDTSLRKISKDKQSEKPFEDRFFHAKKAFEFIKSDRIIEGLHVLLVDDIFTTGASLNEIARLYKLRGARKVTCVVFMLSGVIESNGCSSQG
ncbi:ComF family protein [Leptospira biflexa]|uniref:ComF family protein n=2 Tax=Leptospira biflexa TaxID=172 RepID=UPI001083E19F|nr:ComF family protein [Leptospira biflexa]TGM35386.1 ComF family protein [Leptospira biflexa]